MCLCLPLHFLYFILRQSAGGSDGYLLLLAGAFIVSLHVEDTIGVDVEFNLNLGHTPRCRQDTIKHKPSQGSIIGCHRPLALKDVNFDTGLIISSRAENLALGGRDSGIAGDEGGCHSTKGLDAQSKGGHIKEKDILDISLEHSCLNGGANSYHLIGVDPLMRFFAEKLLYLIVD